MEITLPRLTPKAEDLREAVTLVVKGFVAENAKFSAYEVTSNLRRLYPTSNIEHESVKNTVVELMNTVHTQYTFELRQTNDGQQYRYFVPGKANVSVSFKVGEPTLEAKPVEDKSSQPKTKSVWRILGGDFKFNDAKSSVISAWYYDDLFRSLHIIANDVCYIYSGVPSSVVEEFVNAPSLGAFWSQKIANNYRFVKHPAKKVS